MGPQDERSVLESLNAIVMFNNIEEKGDNLALISEYGMCQNH